MGSPMLRNGAYILRPHKPKGNVAKNSGSKHTFDVYISPVLMRVANKITHDRVTPRERKRGSPKPKLTDEQVLEMRRRHEKEGWTAQQCAEHYGLTLEHTKRHLDYTVRSRLIP